MLYVISLVGRAVVFDVCSLYGDAPSVRPTSLSTRQRILPPPLLLSATASHFYNNSSIHLPSEPFIQSAHPRPPSTMFFIRQRFRVPLRSVHSCLRHQHQLPTTASLVQNKSPLKCIHFNNLNDPQNCQLHNALLCVNPRSIQHLLCLESSVKALCSAPPMCFLERQHDHERIS